MSRVFVAKLLHIDFLNNTHYNDYGGDIMNTIGNRVKLVRTRKGLSQGDLGNLTDTHRTTINSIERNGETVSAKKLLSISKALGCSLNYLITGEEDKPLDVSHIMGDVTPTTSFDNAVVFDKLHTQHDAIVKYIYSLHRSSFIEEVPVIFERSLKLARQEMDNEDFLLPTSCEYEVITKWIDSYTDTYIKHLKKYTMECFNINL